MANKAAAFDTEVAPPPRPTASSRLALQRIGLTLTAAIGGVYGLASVITYSPADPSFNVATNAAASNLLGGPGAMFADLALQTMGAATPAALIAVGAAGAIRIANKRMANPISVSRVLSGASGVALLAGLAAHIPAPGAWPLGAGFGGMLGDGVKGLLNAATSAISLPGEQIISALLCLTGAVVAGGWAFRVSKSDVNAMAEAARRAALDAASKTATTIAAMRKPAELPAPQADADWAPLPDPVLPAPPVRDRISFTPAIDTPMPAAPQRAAAAPVQDYEPPRPPPQRAAPAPAPSAAPAAPRPNPRPPVQQGEFAFAANDQFELPSADFLSPPKPRTVQADGAALKAASQRLAAVLADYGVQGEIVAARPGPVVTLFELEPAPGVKSARVVGLADDIARSMSATSARVAVIPGRNAIGIELPNPKRETVYLRTLLESRAFVGNQGGLPLALGETIEGEPFAADLAKMPHLLIAGTTGSGKSVGINAMILSLLYRHGPEECQFIMIDPKMLELSVYEGIPHLLAPVVTDPKKAVVALKWTVREMEERYRRMAKLGVRSIHGFNERVAEAIATGERLERSIQRGIDPDTGEPIIDSEEIPLERMPYIVVVIDEMADLMLTAGKDIEAAVQRLAQMARAAGIHVIMATQRPSVDVITGTIKANFPTRISYSVTSKIDSRTILGEQGAEQLLGMGDCLFMAGGGRIQRLHGPFVTEREVERVVQMLRAQGAPKYRNEVLEDPDAVREEEDLPFDEATGSSEDLYDRAVQIVIRDRRPSTSYIQRRLSVGYNKAALLIERMEKDGIVSAAQGASQKREVLVDARE